VMAFAAGPLLLVKDQRPNHRSGSIERQTRGCTNKGRVLTLDIASGQ
jgi:hypothetical protein